jgi:predicted secreted protein
MKQVISHSLPERLFIVLLFCSEKEYLRRCRETKHEVLPYKEHNAAFSKALVFLSDWVEQENKIRAGTCSHGIKLRVVSVDTTNLPEDRLKIICHKIEEQAEDFYAK